MFYYLENENIATPIQLKVYDNWVFQGNNKLIVPKAEVAGAKPIGK